jgi:hypothetical protein
MNDKLDNWVNELQTTILTEDKEMYSQQVLERWRNPKNWGR